MDDVLVVGETLVDIVLRDATTAGEHPGGSPANVALGLGRLGRQVSLLSRLGDDERGERVRAHLEASGVTLTPGTVAAGPTSTATARLDELGVASYEFELDWRLPDDVELPPARALHTGSIAAFLAPGGESVLELVHRARGNLTVSYDPNARPVLMGNAGPARERVERFAAAADVVKVSDEDLGYLYPDRSPLDVAREWVADRVTPMLVVVTRGGQGAFAVTPLAEVTVPPPLPVPVVDTVGAGDSFMSGLIDALRRADLLRHEHADTLRRLDRSELTAVVTDAALCASITVSRAGADPPTRAELDALRPA